MIIKSEDGYNLSIYVCSRLGNPKDLEYLGRISNPLQEESEESIRAAAAQIILDS